MAEYNNVSVTITGHVAKNLLKGLSELREELRKLSVSAGSGQMGDMQKSLNRMGKSLDKVLTDVKKSFGEVTEQADEAVKGSRKVAEATEEAGESAEKAAQHTKIYNDALYNLKGYQDSTIESQKESTRRASQLATQVVRLNRSVDELGVMGRNTQDLSENLDAADVAAAELNKDIKRTANGFVPLTEEGRKVLNLTEEQSKAIKGLNGQYDDLADSIRKLPTIKITDLPEKQLKNYRSYINGLSRGLFKVKDSIPKKEFLELNEIIDQFSDRIESKIGTSVSDVRERIKNLEKFDVSVLDEESVSRLKSRVNKVSRSLGDLQESGKASFAEIKNLDRRIRTLRDNFSGLTEAQKEQIKASDALKARREEEKRDAKERAQLLRDFRNDIRERSPYTLMYEQLEDLEERDFELIPSTQIGPVRNKINRLSRDLENFRTQLSAEEYTDFAERLGGITKRLNKQRKDLDAATQAYQAFTDGIKKALRTYNNLTGAFIRQVHFLVMIPGVIAAVTAAYAALGVWATKAGKTLIDTANKLTMSVEKLQELQYAASATGTSVRDLRDALGEMNTAIVDAIQGTGSAEDALIKTLGFGREELKSLAGETNTAFNQIIKKISEVDNSAKQLQLAKDIFGDAQGTSLMSLINRGVSGLEELRKEAHELGIVLEEETAAQANAAWTSLLQLWNVIKNKFIKAAADASPRIRSMAEALMDMEKESQIFYKLFKDSIIPALETTLMTIGHLIDFTRTLIDAFGDLSKAGEALFKSMKLLQQINPFSPERYFLGIFGSIEDIQETRKEINKLWEEASREPEGDISGKFKEALNTLKELGVPEEYTNFLKNSGEYGDSISSLSDSMSGLTDVSTDFFDRIKKLAEDADREDIANIEKLIPFSEENIKDQIEKLKSRRSDLVEQVKSTMSDISGSIKPGTGDVSNIFTGSDKTLFETVLGPETEEGRRFQLLSTRIENLTKKWKKELQDIPIEAKFERVQRKSETSMERVKNKFNEGTKELIEWQEGVINSRIANYQKLLDQAVSERVQDKLKQAIEEQQTELNEIRKEGSQNWLDYLNEQAERERDTRLSALKSEEDATEETYRKKRDILEDYSEKVKSNYNEVIAYVKKKLGEDHQLVSDLEEKKRQEIEKTNRKRRQNLEELGNIQQEVWERDAERREAVLDKQQSRIDSFYDNENQKIIENYQTKRDYLQREFNEQERQIEKMRRNRDKYSNEDIAKGEQELYELKTELYKHEVENYEKAQEAKIKLHGNWADQVELGLKNVTDSTRTWGEMVVDLTEGLSNTMVDNFTSAWQSWITGSKTASEAAKSFAMDTLSYINKIIMRQMIMNSLFGSSASGSSGIAGAIGSGLKSLFGSGSASTNQFYTSTYGSQSSLSPFEPATFDKMHSGGIVGKDAGDKVREISENLMNVAPRLHNGLKPDEYPAVLQKGEGVFTKGQMEAMGGGTEVNIIDKRSGNAPQAEVQESQGRDGRKQVQVLIKDEMKKNMNSGSMDKEMKKNYGIGRKSTRR